MTVHLRVPSILKAPPLAQMLPNPTGTPHRCSACRMETEQNVDLGHSARKYGTHDDWKVNTRKITASAQLTAQDL
jgi:hypothetical protein